MVYADVTLAPDDIEWERVREKNVWHRAAFNPELLEQEISERGIGHTLRQMTWMHRMVANQLLRAEISSHNVSDWGDRTIYLCNRLKRVRGMLRTRYAREVGEVQLEALIRECERAWPRAVPYKTREEAS